MAADVLTVAADVRELGIQFRVSSLVPVSASVLYVGS